jgi:xanthine dehydrogenase accessory factor
MYDDLPAVIDALHQAQANGDPVALATVISTHGSMPRHAGSKLLVRQDGSIVGTVGGGAMESQVIQAALAAIQQGQTRLETYHLNNLEDGDPGICGGSAQIFIEPIGTVSTLLVIGAGHVGAEVAALGKWLGFRVIISDDREALCNETHIPGLDDYIVCPPAELAQQIAITPRTYVTAVTRGLPIDLDLIPALLKTDARYIGLIGSQRRWAITKRQLSENYGLTPDDLRRIRSPIGLELEAETPKEIALSILAEIVMLQRGGDGTPMQMVESEVIE